MGHSNNTHYIQEIDQQEVWELSKEPYNDKLICHLGICAKIISQTPFCTVSTDMAIYTCIEGEKNKCKKCLSTLWDFATSLVAFANEK